jgi:hypothetical protein
VLLIVLLCFQALNTAIPLLLPKTNDDVKMSVIVDSLPRLSTKQKLDVFQDSEEEVNLILIKTEISN